MVNAIPTLIEPFLEAPSPQKNRCHYKPLSEGRVGGGVASSCCTPQARAAIRMADAGIAGMASGGESEALPASPKRPGRPRKATEKLREAQKLPRPRSC